MLAVPRWLLTRARLRATRRARRSAAFSVGVAALGMVVLASCSPIPTTAFIFPLSRAQAWGPGTWSQDQGVDINAPCGANLGSPENGVIIAEGIGGFGPYAPELLVTAGPLTGRMIYLGHVQLDYVPVGAHVRAGQWIAQVGTLGISFACHVEIGISPPGSRSLPAYHQTSAEMLSLLASSYFG
jgi:murein DD-endopeptidase MepM/ murein hydrolase activator NlpD